MTDRVVLITGASSGLGLAIARALLSHNYQLILTAREASLARFAAHGIVESDRVMLRALDVASDSERKAVIAEANERFGGVDVLLNNAGISLRSVVEHVTEADRRLQMAINFEAPLELTRLVLPRMRKRRWGRILNISSVGGMMAMPTMSIYSASKFALEGASEALWYEVRPFGIYVTLIQPGFINSDGFENVRYTTMSRNAHDTVNSAYHWHYHYMAGFIGRVARRVPATPDSVARTVLRTIEAKAPPLRVPATFDARVFSLLRRLLPRTLYHWVLYNSLPQVREWGPRKPR
ncbi:MAG TPA: SDR family oxidoreductase [Polyangiaceae bacterium]|nr:SDR family oxidoreductase [Polyangiaceae bacterium]